MPKPKVLKQAKPKKGITTQAEMNKAIWSVCDILRRDKTKGAKAYIPELTWMLFLRFWDLKVEKDAREAEEFGQPKPDEAIPKPYRWRDWAAPGSPRREEVWRSGGIAFVNTELFPRLRELGDKSGTAEQHIIGEIFRAKDRTNLIENTNFWNTIDKIHAITSAQPNEQHFFSISQAYEGLLLRLGEKNSDGGQFFTPREIIRAMVQAVKPRAGKTVYDPCCGTGGFLVEAYKAMEAEARSNARTLEHLRHKALWGREDDTDTVTLMLANLLLHGVAQPRIWHGNTLTGRATYGELFADAPKQFDYIFTNPPFGSKEGIEAQARFDFKTNKAQILFIQHIMSSLAKDGTCAMVIDEGVLFHTKTAAYTATKQKLLNDCDVWCILSLPPGVFVNAGAGVKTDILFFTKGRRTERIWYYDLTLADDLSVRKVNKGNLLTLEHFNDFLQRLHTDPDAQERLSPRSWWVTREEILTKKYDLKAMNPNAPDRSDKRTVTELLEIIRQSSEEIEQGFSALQRKNITKP
ncbi:MAG: N-6 DNA methylase [Candidatus Kapaibacterium sp.]|nr:MAG: N-6 DNA methylase [Candidatus Kapabacteria bacterium]